MYMCVGYVYFQYSWVYFYYSSVDGEYYSGTDYLQKDSESESLTVLISDEASYSHYVWDMIISLKVYGWMFGVSFGFSGGKDWQS